MREELDVDNGGFPTIPEKRYLIFGTPRSGTNLLSDLMRQCNLGVPAEYFTNYAIRKMMTMYNTHSIVDLMDVLMQRRTTENGIFGAKAVSPLEVQRIDQWIIPEVHIRVLREDKKAQAKSLAHAQKTQYWADVGDKTDRPVPIVVTEDEVANAAALIEYIEGVWDTQINPTFTISYEFLIQDAEQVLRNLMESFEVDVPDDWSVPRPVVRKLPAEDGVVELDKMI